MVKDELVIVKDQGTAHLYLILEERVDDNKE